MMIPATSARRVFPLADEVVVLEAFHDCFMGRSVGPNASVVIMTRGHAHDQEVLAQALQSQAGYIGMMGMQSRGAGPGRASRTNGILPGRRRSCALPNWVADRWRDA